MFVTDVDQGVGKGGGWARNIISDLVIFMLRSDMHALCYGGSGAWPPPPKNLNGAIWCVLVCILIRFCL